ncbi:hypothetical protein ACUNV4_24615, partial [Granulosicoccus sp. 3-233]|uniref:hypothetical protein n=1 Tax=Granulosicoccus sp. 3-233 TaxID=3417969 RepID=UPI003D32945A
MTKLRRVLSGSLVCLKGYQEFWVDSDLQNSFACIIHQTPGSIDQLIPQCLYLRVLKVSSTLLCPRSLMLKQ